MLVVFSFCQKDEELALKNAEWIVSLKNSKQHSFLIAHDSRCNPVRIMDILHQKFEHHLVLSIRDHWNKSPNSPGAMFAQSARHLEYNFPEVKYFLWYEMDAMPVQDYWLDKIEDEYLRAGRPFMGALVNRWNDCPEHLSGIAVYPNPLIKYAGLMLLSEGENVFFDIVDADNVRNQSHFTDLIQNRTSQRVKEGEVWRSLEEPPPFKDKADFYSVATKECVLFHSDKYGRIPEIFGGDGQVSESTTAETPPKPSPSKTNLGKPRKQASIRMPLPLHTPKEGEVNNGMVFINGGWRTVVSNLPDLVKSLKDIADKDGFSRMRVYKALIGAGLREKKKK